MQGANMSRDQRTIRRAATWMITLALATILSASYLLDGPSEIDAALDVAADLHDLSSGKAVLP
jgi:hypothetical protein